MRPFSIHPVLFSLLVLLTQQAAAAYRAVIMIGPRNSPDEGWFYNSVADASMRMGQVLLLDLQVPAGNILYTADWAEATVWMVRHSKPGDTLIFYFAGHGTSTELPRGGRMVWHSLVSAQEKEKPRAIYDMSLKSLLDKLNYGNYIVIVDACESQGFVDNVSGPNRFIAAAASYGESEASLNARMAWITGDGKQYERSLWEKNQPFLTYHLANVLSERKYKTWSTVFGEVKLRMRISWTNILAALSNRSFTGIHPHFSTSGDLPLLPPASPPCDTSRLRTNFQMETYGAPEKVIDYCGNCAEEGTNYYDRLDELEKVSLKPDPFGGLDVYLGFYDCYQGAASSACGYSRLLICKDGKWQAARFGGYEFTTFNGYMNHNDGKLLFTESVWGDSDAHCCPTGWEKGEFRWDGSLFQRRVTKRKAPDR